MNQRSGQGRGGGRDDRPRARDGRRDSAGHQRGAARMRGDGRRSAAAPSMRDRSSDEPRAAAFDVLVDVETNDAYANLVLPARLARADLGGRDAAFATELAYGTLRMQGHYDAILSECVDRALPDIDAPVRVALRLGAHQLLGMRVPAHAAVSQTVGLVRHKIGAGPAQFVNAVLRKVSTKTADQWQAGIAAQLSDPVELASFTYSHPAWIVRALKAALVANGRDPGELEELLRADNTPAPVMLVARPGLIDPAELLTHSGGGRVARLSPFAVEAGAVPPRHIAAVKDGRAGVQDEGSQLVALALAAAPIDGRDKRWLDMCAGPGGKTALLAALAARRGARVVANEVQPHRAGLVRKNVAAAAPGSIEAVRTADGRDIGGDEPGSFDRVLVDAPCTGLGALRRRPEARWRKQPSDLPELSALQRELLESALAAVRPGGIVAYVTCSPHVAETKLVVDDVIRGRDDIEIVDAARVLESVVVDPGDSRVDFGAGPAIQLWPHIHHTDAMHATMLRRLR
ncbi:RsmB/NOP family class I SAM-dependent RNA methyltransferase [Rarobacter incanus]|uniref:16S rRNA (Cytosine967-C5)-methyltransferase n=1 Tax=Rarobacter incanus TaxID=153494 RepID=A0A542SN37_9MICO|nr:transcription antitermination factor NusB [Rarobacter incanus]TQK75657.1 16S rRNA (cytosine967-C5)-methyltransferase [Rarobacter incanus]